MLKEVLYITLVEMTQCLWRSRLVFLYIFINVFYKCLEMCFYVSTGYALY